MNPGPWSIVRSRGTQWVYFLLTGLIVVLPALMNNSPLVYSDSGTYMRVAFDIEPPIDRPFGYSLIIRAVTWRATMWTVVFFQGAIASWLLYLSLRQLFPGARNLRRPHLVLIGALVLFSSLPWYAAQIMPDVFAGFLGIIVYLLFFGRRMGNVKTAFLWVLLFFFTISHYSFMAMMMGLAVLLLIARVTRWGRRAMAPRFWRNWSCFVVMVIAGVITVMGSNQQHGRGMVLSPTSDLFLASKLCESGVMREHLQRTCADHPRPQCARMEELDRTAMYHVWQMDSPMRNGHSGLDDASAELAPLVEEVLSDPRNWGSLLWTSVNATLIQLTQYTIGSGIEPYREGSSPWLFYHNTLPRELAMYMGSWEQRGVWRFEAVNTLAGPMLFLSLLIILLLWPSGTVRWQLFAVILLATVVFNAAATGALANVYDRLQARVTWLMIFVALVLMLERWAACRAFFFFPRSAGAGK